MIGRIPRCLDLVMKLSLLLLNEYRGNAQTQKGYVDRGERQFCNKDDHLVFSIES